MQAEYKYYTATIYYRMKGNNPDWGYVKDHRKTLNMDYTARFDLNWWWGEDDIIEHLKHELMLMAGGGYSTDTIKNVRFEIAELTARQYQRKQEMEMKEWERQKQELANA